MSTLRKITPLLATTAALLATILIGEASDSASVAILCGVVALILSGALVWLIVKA